MFIAIGFNRFYTDSSTIILFFRYIHTHVWSKASYFSKPLSKGPYTTTWIWKLHSEAHDFEIHTFSTTAIRARKILSSNLTHLSLIFLWIGGLSFHSTYFSNYSFWLKDPRHNLCTAQYVWSIIGQDIINSDLGGYYEGIRITSGVFQLCRCLGIVSPISLKCSVVASFTGTLVSIEASYIHMHINLSFSLWSSKFKALTFHQLSVLFGLNSISYAGHIIHISIPVGCLLDSGVDSCVIEVIPQDLLSFLFYKSISSVPTGILIMSIQVRII